MSDGCHAVGVDEGEPHEIEHSCSELMSDTRGFHSYCCLLD